MRIRAKMELSPYEIKQLVEKYYGYEILDIQKVRAVYKLETDQGTVAFKSAKKIKDIHFIDSVIHHLHSHGFLFVPSLKKTNRDTLLLAYGQNDYVVEQWLPSDVHEIHPYERDWLFFAGQTLAEFHYAIASYPFHHVSKKRVRRPWGEWFDHKLHQLKYTRSGNDTKLNYWLLDRMKHAKAQHYHYPTITTQLCHGSLHQENIMMNSNKKVWLIDFERLTYDAIGKDLAQVLMYHFRFHPWNKEDVEQFLTGYQNISPLRKEDLHHFCTRSLILDRNIYAFLEGKQVVFDVQQEKRKEAVLREIIPSYWDGYN
ncbi:phosphotransferase [Shimazuella kribbensis]|uniref:phosphotransferase n=1 Tax=Shimazuella kribbensis TaxID=139808 RepID=UPI00042059A3|nr:phosphotransferase [Shimazuella kribbensis]